MIQVQKWRSIHCTQSCGDAYQGLSLINQCDGKLFMIGTHNGNSWGWGGDGADLYSLELDNDSIKVQFTHCIFLLEKFLKCTFLNHILFGLT